MFRSFFIYLSKAAWARRIVTQWGFAWRAASRFISGEKLEDAIQVIRVLNAKKINASLDHLGEHTTNPDEARNATEDILKVFSGIQQAGVQANISIKLTQIGLALDEGLCRENLLRILQCARDSGNFVRIDMEDSPWVDSTLGLYRMMRFDYGFENVGVVIQSYLFRSEEDIRKIAAESGRVRLCKGAYKEPPEIAYPKKSDVDESYDRLARILMDGAKMAGSTELSGGGLIPPPTALATHDPQRIEKAKQYAESIGLPKGALEFQMLHGIRRDLQEQLAAQGYPVRVYVPYGTEWYPYFTRRLAERQANVWFFLSNLVRK